jgi:tRNA/tmRNA/rRNA uracil-C5-methylase (TrmA/RlmC/RlmD family)
MQVDDPSTLNLGDKAIVTIYDVGFGGEGVAKIGGEMVVFVPFVLVGEEVEIELTEIKKRFGRGRVLRMIKSSPDRAEPLCQYFGDCGGCQYQHIAYPTQLQIKRKQISDLIERIGGFPPGLVSPVVPCPAPYGYRNRIMIRSQWDKFKQGLNIGFIRADNRLVVDIEECKIAEPALNTEITRVRKNPPPKGGLKVVVRVPPKGWEVPPDSFFQNNFFLLPELVRVVRNCLQESGSRFLIDAYCGVGFFGIEAADLVEHFVGIELDTPAIKAAKRNAASRQIANGEFLSGRTEDLLPSVLSRFDAQKTTVIIDPPRTGCPSAMLELLRQTSPGQLIYVSCHPATLARDLNILCANNVFELKNVLPLDMFPQTQHVECVADVRVTKQSA